MTATEQVTINKMQIKQAEMTINLNNVQEDVKEIKSDIKEVKDMLTAQNTAMSSLKEASDSKYVTKKFVIASMGLAGTLLALIAYFWQAYGSNFHK